MSVYHHVWSVAFLLTLVGACEWRAPAALPLAAWQVTSLVGHVARYGVVDDAMTTLIVVAVLGSASAVILAWAVHSTWSTWFIGQTTVQQLRVAMAYARQTPVVDQSDLVVETVAARALFTFLCDVGGEPVVRVAVMHACFLVAIGTYRRVYAPELDVIDKRVPRADGSLPPVKFEKFKRRVDRARQQRQR